MLHDYITPEERLAACRNQDVVCGFGGIDARRCLPVVQVPDFSVCGRSSLENGDGQRPNPVIFGCSQ
jgi:hypothetical protein